MKFCMAIDVVVLANILKYCRPPKTYLVMKTSQSSDNQYF